MMSFQTFLYHVKVMKSHCLFPLSFVFPKIHFFVCVLKKKVVDPEMKNVKAARIRGNEYWPLSAMRVWCEDWLTCRQHLPFGTFLILWISWLKMNPVMNVWHLLKAVIHRTFKFHGLIVNAYDEFQRNLFLAFPIAHFASKTFQDTTSQRVNASA